MLYIGWQPLECRFAMKVCSTPLLNIPLKKAFLELFAKYYKVVKKNNKEKL